MKDSRLRSGFGPHHLSWEGEILGSRVCAHCNLVMCQDKAISATLREPSPATTAPLGLQESEWSPQSSPSKLLKKTAFRTVQREKGSESRKAGAGILAMLQCFSCLWKRLSAFTLDIIATTDTEDKERARGTDGTPC